MKRFFQTLTLLAVFVSCTWAEKYPQMATMVEVQRAVDDALKTTDPKDILVIFDIDSTLIMSKDSALHMTNIIKYRPAIHGHFADLSQDHRNLMLNLCTQRPSQLLDVDTPKVIDYIKNKGIKAIACTAASPGPFKQLNRAEVVRYETLKRYGIDFSGAFPDYADLTLVNVKGFLGRQPVFYQGVLCAAGEKNSPNKGKSVVEFLQTTHTNPKLIIFIDDNKNYLIDLHQAIKMYFPTTQFIGIEFTGELHQRTDFITEEQFVAYWKELATEAQAEIESKMAAPAA
ncbi:MAG: DUF2608 domain-containing protein [Alphaproteobacteria bacterium]|nr:DUF2608 domain-containing protein [Alphaproteobacteria bacterium]